MTGTQARVAITIGVLALALAAQWVPTPGLVGLPLDWPPGMPGERARLFGLGMVPYLSGTALLMLASGGSARLAELREGTPLQRAAFDRACALGAFVVAAIWGYAWWLYGSMLSDRSGGAPAATAPVLVIVSVASATLLLIWLAIQVSRRGLGNGVALLVVTAGSLPGMLVAGHRSVRLRVGADRGEAILMMLVFGLACVAACVAFVRARRDVTLVTVEAAVEDARAARVPPVIPVRMNLLGTIPAALSVALLTLVLTIQSFLPAGESVWSLSSNPVAYDVAFVLLLVFVSLLWLGLAFDMDHLDRLLERYGYRPADAPDGARASAVVARMVERQTMPAVLALATIILAVKYVQLDGLGLRSFGLSGIGLLTFTAVGLDTHRQWATHQELQARADAAAAARTEAPAEALAEPEDRADDFEEAFVELAETDTELEASLLADRLARAGIDSAVLANRALPLWGTLSLWEWTVPRFPALIPHRRLGGGRVIVTVRDSRFSEAQRIRARYTAPEPSGTPVPPT